MENGELKIKALGECSFSIVNFQFFERFCLVVLTMLASIFTNSLRCSVITCSKIHLSIIFLGI